MVLSEICSTSFLFSIAIIIIVIGGLFAYFNHRLTAQNHKISSMMGLVTTMAEEMQYFRSKLSGKTQENYKMPDADLIHIVPQFLGGITSNLIEVSDGEDDDESDDDESDDEESVDEESVDEESDEEESDEEESDEDDEVDEDLEIEVLEEALEEALVGDKDNIKSINISIDLGDDIDLNIEEDIVPETKTINLSEDISSFEITSKSLENINDIDIGIKLTNDYADMTESNKEKTDYKKLSINKLRDIVIEKGLVVDASKLKKNDILKMLGAEQ